MYCSVEDIKNRLAPNILLQLTDMNGDGQPDTPIIMAAIADADAEINAYLGNRYVVPFTEPPAIVQQISALLAITNLFARLPGLMPEEQRYRAEQARRLLQFLAQFLAHAELDISQAPETILRHFIASTTQELTRIFARETLSNF
ncbi:MAG: DUF1320 domain-containing protein [Candidatus Sumerlaeia bacterium]|nr:DUF1320 domain-containing protein [Candidatus Sumerlaeia bacterium]